MEFSEFAQVIAPIMYTGAKSELCRQLLEGILEYPSKAFEYVHSCSSNTLRSYYSGFRTIHTLSCRISRNLDTVKFASAIDELNPAVQQRLSDALAAQLDYAPAHLFSHKCAELYADIIYTAAESGPLSGSTDETDRLTVENGLIDVINALGNLSDEDVKSLTRTHMNAVRVKRKAVGCAAIFVKQMESHVSQYYRFIQEQLGSCESRGLMNFGKVAAQVKLCYETLKEQESSLQEIYYKVTEWLICKSGSTDRLSCEILTSFFVQNCEVFDAPAK